MAGKKRKRGKTLARTVRADRRNMEREEKEKEKENETYRPWSDLPTELVELIVSGFNLRQNIVFSATCKRWHSIAVSVRQVNQCPWLLFIHRTTGTCEFYDPSNRKTYISENPELKDANILGSKDGWLVVYSGEFHMFLFNPLTKDKVELPNLAWCNEHAVLSSAPPNCSVILMKDFQSEVLVISCVPGDTLWTCAMYEKDLIPFDFDLAKPFYHDGLIYCLSGLDRLGIFSPETHLWTIVQISASDLPSNMIGKALTTDINGELVVVCMHSNEGPIVLKVERLKDGWARMDNLEGHTMFVSYLSSYMMVEVPTVMRNSVYFPKQRMFGKRCISYSLHDRRYYPSRQRPEWGEHGPFGSQTGPPCVWIKAPKTLPPSLEEV